ncbi:SAP30-binding protein-like [Uloborus diversus]|uniref:SAP30-binding protein-like n=1 Tax=Uloborus diversus TaxID=327109 RepID=UPI002409B2E6|nr:SAP30-binding protein-like [Uloborus diversus]
MTLHSTAKDKQHSKLVSYTAEGQDEEMSDSDESRSSSDQREDSLERIIKPEVPPLSPVSFHRSLLNLKSHEIELPVEQTGRCSKALQEKIGELYEKKKEGKDMNASIQRRKDFRNPSIYEKLIQFCNIDEQGTNYPPEIYDPHCWGPESFYEELAKRQKEEMDKREKEKKERTKVEFISGTVKKTSDSSADAGKRKSKWDVGMNQMPAAALKPAALITPSVLPVPTGTKPTVISAFGTITKKVKQ